MVLNFLWSSILLSWRNLPSCSIWSLVTPTSLFEIFIWALLSSTWMCSDVLGCLKLTLGTKYLEVCRYLQQQIQAMQEKPSTFFVGWFGYTMDPPFVVLVLRFFRPRYYTSSHNKAAAPEAPRDSSCRRLGFRGFGEEEKPPWACLGLKDIPVISKGFTTWDDQNPFSTIFWNVVHCSSSFLIDASRPSSLRGGEVGPTWMKPPGLGKM